MKETSASRKPSLSLLVGALLLTLFTTLPAQGDKEDSRPPYYGERYRPQFHFSPERNWTNDPNGMVFYDGEYHLHYQYNPEGDRWGHMSWAHAVSKDLVHWEHLPLALREEAGIMAFSGSAVVDRDDTAGFRRGAADPALVAIYTGHRVADERQTQYLASSTDRGRTWRKFENNPVLETEAKAFRDPKVFWHEPTKKWVMAVVLADEKKCRFYGSADLKKWVLLSEFGAAGIPNVKNWECPDLFELPVEKEPGTSKWVLHINVGGGAIAGGSGGQYFVGNFDGTTFTNDNPPTQALHTDYGKDFYAAVTWSNIPQADGRRLWIAWMNNWQYANDVPTHPWRGQMSIPRSIALKKFSEGLRLVQAPVAELKMLRGEHEHRDETPIEAAKPLKARLNGDCLEIIAEFEPKDATEFGLRVRKGAREETTIGYEVRANQLFVDRTASGKVDFHADFSGNHIAPLSLDNGRIKLHIFVDRCSVEVFANGGRAVLTDLIFPSPESNGVELYAKGGSAKLISMDVWRLKSAWPEKR